MRSYRTGGLRDKYRVEKTDGTPIDPDARYFILRYDVDPHAREALRVYADSVDHENPQLADDIRQSLKDTEVTAAQNAIRVP